MKHMERNNWINLISCLVFATFAYVIRLSSNKGVNNMIIKKLKMLLFTLLPVIFLIGVATGCTPTGDSNQSISPEVTLLNAEESEYFNSDEFFNGEYMNIRNQFLSSLYDAPENIDLFQLFYNGSGLEDTITVEEKEAVVAYNGWDTEPDCPCTKISRSSMDEVLTEYMGLTLADTEKIGLENFTYLEEYDAYYHYHGDTNYRMLISFSGGEREGNFIRLFYDDQFMSDGGKVLTLREQAGSYLFVSNEKK